MARCGEGYDTMTAYSRGRSKEYRLQKKLRDEGYACTRSAGSHGAWDIVAVHAAKKEILFVQSKSKSLGESARQRLKKAYGWLNGTFVCTFVVM